MQALEGTFLPDASPKEPRDSMTRPQVLTCAPLLGDPHTQLPISGTAGSIALLQQSLHEERLGT